MKNLTDVRREELIICLKVDSELNSERKSDYTYNLLRSEIYNKKNNKLDWSFDEQMMILFR